MITLLTDFGRTDTYVGQMHAVIASLSPTTRTVDLTHDIAPQNILQAALTLEDAVEACPAGTVHVVVVDPGVGSNRRAIAAEIGSWTFVGPDNGVLTAVLQRWPLIRAIELTNPKYHRGAASRTFHGRDVFSPVAAHLANGVALELLGPSLSGPLIQLELPQPQVGADAVTGTVLWVDHFGNLITNIRRDHLRLPPQSVHTVSESQIPIVRCYADVPDHTLLALFGSSGRLEISVRNGSAAKLLNAEAGTAISCR